MPVPQVEPATWRRVEAIAQVEMGLLDPPVSSLSFNRQVGLIIENTGGVEKPFTTLKPGGAYTSRDLENRAPHPAWREETETETVEQRESVNSKSRKKLTYSIGLVFSYERPDRERVHRPQVSNDVMFRLASVVQEKRERVPISDLDFQQVLSLFLEIVEEMYQEYVAVEVVEIEAGADVIEAVDVEEKIGRKTYQTMRPFYHIGGDA